MSIGAGCHSRTGARWLRRNQYPLRKQLIANVFSRAGDTLSLHDVLARGRQEPVMRQRNAVHFQDGAARKYLILAAPTVVGLLCARLLRRASLLLLSSDWFLRTLVRVSGGHAS